MARRAQALTDPSRAMVYLRVSTEEQAQNGASLAAQHREAMEYAARSRLKVVQVYTERGATGTDDNRPEFRRMLATLAEPGNRVGTVLVVHTSRFMRDATKARLHKAQLRRQGVRVVSVQQHVDDDPNGHFIEGMFELIDQLESEQIGRRTRAGMKQNARNGFWNGSKPPFGFRVVSVPGPGDRPKRKLEVDPAESEVVRQVFALYLANHGAVGVASELNAAGARHRGKYWDRDKVLRVVSDTAVVGEARWGRRNARTGVAAPEEDVAVVPVEPIVDRELFDLAQAERACRDPDKNPGRASPLLLAGLVRCGHCSERYELQTTGKQRPDGGRYAYYQCSAARRRGVGSTCPGRPLPTEALDRAVLEFLIDKLFSVERCNGILKEVVERDGLLRHRAAQERRRWESEARSLRRRQAKLIESIETAAVAAHLLGPRLAEVASELQHVDSILHKVRVIHESPAQLYAPQTLERFRALITEEFLSDEGTARAYLRATVESVVVRTDGGVEVVGKKPSDADSETAAAW